MTENNVPDPWAVKVTENNIGTPINIDDGGGPSFKFGYDTANTLTITSSLSPRVGFWRVNESFHIHATKRPGRLHRMMTKLLLGWEWVDL